MSLAQNLPAPVAGTDRSNDFHPIADLWPMMPEDELDKLAADIKYNDLHTPIWRHRDGRIIDGRNRWLACKRAGVECTSRTYNGRDGAELASFVFSLNEHRRHLTADQRAAIAAELTGLVAGTNQHTREVSPIGDTSPAVSNAEAATVTGVSERAVERAKATKRAAPDLHEQVKAGTLKASKARAEAAARKPKTTLPTSKSDAEDRQKQADRTALINALEGFRQRQLVTIVRKYVPELDGAEVNTPKPPPQADSLIAELRSVCHSHFQHNAELCIEHVCAALRELCRQVELGGLTAIPEAA
jgi:ParB-like chromosome segregation protein Spo0J